MARLLAAYLLAFGVGMFCKYFEIPAPAPPVIPGALLVVAMTFGYAVGDKILPKKNGSNGGTTISANATAGADKSGKKSFRKCMRNEAAKVAAFFFCSQHFSIDSRSNFF